MNRDIDNALMHSPQKFYGVDCKPPPKKERKKPKKAKTRLLKPDRDCTPPIDTTLNHYERERRATDDLSDEMRLHCFYDGGVHFGRDPCGDPGRYVGKSQEDDGHILIVGGPGSHKTTGIILPTLLTWRGTFVAIDIKGDISSFCMSHRRNMEYETKIIDFADGCGATFHYDPYLTLRNGSPEELISNARGLALALIPSPNDIREPFWIQGAQNILTAIILYAFGHGIGFNDTIDMILSTPVDMLRKAIEASDNNEAKAFISQFPCDKSNRSDDKALWGCFVDLRNHIIDLAHLQIKKIFDYSDDTIDWKEDISSYNIVIRITESKLNLCSGAVRLMLTQLLSALTDRPDKYSPEGHNQVPVLFQWDEAPRFGKLDVIIDALSTLRSRGVTICMAIQSFAQLDYIYGSYARRIIVDCCNYKIIAAVQDAETQRYCSELVGTEPVWTPSMGENYHPSRSEFGFSRQISRTREPIIYPEEFAALRNFVLLTPHGSFEVEKDPCYNAKNLLPNYKHGNVYSRPPIILDGGHEYIDFQRNYRR